MNYQDRAILYAEEYGIVDYTIKGKYMVYYRNVYGYQEKFTMKHTVDLDTLREVESKRLSKMNKRGDYNR